jgi:riboflavin synthase
MFTGIVEEIGTVQTITDKRIKVLSSTVIEGSKIGDSIAVNGVCLTVTKLDKTFFEADISPETLKVTTLGELKSGSSVNLERALTLNSRLGGHIVSGHIDSVGRITKLSKNGSFYELEVELDSKEEKYVAKKGSIAINGISLTVADVYKNRVIVAVIPHTFENTSLKTLKVGANVNIETDILAKYVEKFLSTSDNKSGISMEFLMQNGF